MESDKILVTFPPRHAVHVPAFEFFEGEICVHPEQPIRIERILDALRSSYLNIDIKFINNVSSWVDIETVHTGDYLYYLNSVSKDLEANQRKHFFPFVFPIRTKMQKIRRSTRGHHGFYCFDTITPINAETWSVASTSVECALVGANALVMNENKVIYALCRPPGHHAGTNFYGGYCYLNNAAVAARRLSNVGKVAILDLDYHHGNGTQEIFWEDDLVWTGSIHGHPGFEYPFYSGYDDEIGEGKGTNLNSNIPLPVRTNNLEYMEALELQLERISLFNPDWLIIALGFDTYIQDAEGQFDLTDTCYIEIGRMLQQLGLPILIVQEGGYDSEVMGDLAVKFLNGLLSH